MSSEQSFNNKSFIKNKRSLFVKKINVNSCKEINESINNYFYNPNTYFSTDSPIQVGKKKEITEISYIRNKKAKRTTLMNASSSSKSKGFINKAEKEKERNQFIEKKLRYN